MQGDATRAKELAGLTPEDRWTLSYLARQTRPIWSGVLDRGGDPDLIRFQYLGLVATEACNYYIGKTHVTRGYVITSAGLRALAGEDVQ